MNSKNVVLFERYDGVRFVLERSLLKYQEEITIYASHWKNEIKNLIDKDQVDLLVTELYKDNPEGIELSLYARKVSPEIKIIWITVMGCNLFRDQRNKMGNIQCIEKPLDIKDFRSNVLKALSIAQKKTIDVHRM